jgi:hypothetical protein
MDPIRLDVDTPSRRYTITLGHGLLDRLAPLLDAARGAAPVRRLQRPRLALARSALASAQPEPILLSDGERYKQMAGSRASTTPSSRQRRAIVDPDRSADIGDMAGFAAAAAGIALVHATTLLARWTAPSAAGGEPPLGKNLIGAFHQLRVFIDTSVLAPRRVRRPVSDQIRMTSSPACSTRSPATAPRCRGTEVLIASSRSRVASKPRSSRRMSAKLFASHLWISATPRAAEVTRPGGFATRAVAYGMLVAAELGVLRGRSPDIDRKVQT